MDIAASETLNVRAAHRAVAAIFFFNGAMFGAFASRIPAIKAANGLSEATLGLVLLALAAGALISFQVAAWLTGRFGAASLARIVVVVFIPAVIAVGLSTNGWVLAAMLFVFGFGFGGQDVAMNTWGAEVEKAAKRSIMSGLHGMFSLGAGVGAGSGALAAGVGATPLVHFLVFGVALSIVASLIANVEWESDKAPRDPTTAAPTKPWRALPPGTLLLVGVMALVAFMSEGAIADWSALYLVDLLDASEAAAPIGFVAFSVAMVVGRFSGDAVIQRVGRGRTARGAGVLSVIGGVVVVTAVAPWVAWAGFAVMGLGLSAIAPLAFARAAMDPNMAPGPAIAAVATFGYGGLLLGPPMMGFIAHLTSLQVSFVVITVAVVAPFLFARSMEA